jgi:hypothetical protein
MSQENIEMILRRGYEAINRDGVEGALPFFDPEVELVPIPEGLPDPEHFYGHAGVRRDARALRLESYLDRTQALEAAGLSE